MSSFVETQNCSEVLRQLEVSVLRKNPALIVGPPGCGKSFLISHLAKLQGRPPPLFLFVDEQTDAKSIIGNYECGEVPGEFRWAPGILVTAMTEGRWLVIEDATKVPADVLSVMLPLIEGKKLHIPQKREDLHAHDGFHLFATITTSNNTYLNSNKSGSTPYLNDSYNNINNNDRNNEKIIPYDVRLSVVAGDTSNKASRSASIPPLLLSWMKINMPPPTLSDCQSILVTRFPSLSPVAPLLVKSILALDSQLANRSLGIKSLCDLAERLTAAGLVVPSVVAQMQHDVSIIPERVRALIVEETAAALLAYLPDVRTRMQVAVEFAAQWGISSELATQILSAPHLTVEQDEANERLVVGCFSLPWSDPSLISSSVRSFLASTEAAASFAHTSVQTRILKSLVSNVMTKTPTLLVGDTGTGKTSIIQHLAACVRAPLIVFNLSDQTETSELIGSSRPSEPPSRKAASLFKLWSNELFHTAFSRSKNEILMTKAHGAFAGRRLKELMLVLIKTGEMALQKLGSKTGTTAISSQWSQFIKDCSICLSRLEGTAQSLSFDFVEGPLLKAVKEGIWIILDEMNLAQPDVLQRLQGLLDSSTSPLLVPELPDNPIVSRHPNFRLFACMNPPTLPPIIDERTEEEQALASKRILSTVAGGGQGKKDLPSSLRQRFSEIFVDEVSSFSDLSTVVSSYLMGISARIPVDGIVKFFSQVRFLARTCQLTDGAGRTPHVSLRSLVRALKFARTVATRQYHPVELKNALVDGLCMAFATPLSETSDKHVTKLAYECIGVSLPSEDALNKKKKTAAIVKGGGVVNRFEDARAEVSFGSYVEEQTATVTASSNNLMVKSTAISANNHNADVIMTDNNFDNSNNNKEIIRRSKHIVCVENFWMNSGPLPVDIEKAHKKFVVTESVRSYVRSIARVISGGPAPVLLEGPTSAGKTSLVMFLAGLTGHKCIRINNHEHTDVQEYIGQYVSDPISGQLVFEEGVVAKAAREGTWVVLDELNLAPPEVLEVLNRLLDDNRELFIPETNITIVPHPSFRLFATQNPAGGAYGGRKLLSRAFRNRFVETFIDEIPAAELQTIVEARCAVAPSICALMVSAFKELQTHRLTSSVFAGNHAAATVRDLLRWGSRKPNSPEETAVEGWCLLGERLRENIDKDSVKKILEKCVLKNKSELIVDFVNDRYVVDVRNRISAVLSSTSKKNKHILCGIPIETVAWTDELCRMVALVRRALDHKDPILLVGETGTGKTTVCQVLSWLDQMERNDNKGDLTIFNCHQHTETADLLGSLRPVRDRTVFVTEALAVGQELTEILMNIRQNIQKYVEENAKEDLEVDLNLKECDQSAETTLQFVSVALKALNNCKGGRPEVDDLEGLMERMKHSVMHLISLINAKQNSIAIIPSHSSNDSTVDSNNNNNDDLTKDVDMCDGEESDHSKRRKETPIPLVSSIENNKISSVDSNKNHHTVSSMSHSLLTLSTYFRQNLSGACQMFEWCDGPLIRCMKTGNPFLLDEISLADDAVLERLNSVLEPSRTLYLSEKGASRVGDDESGDDCLVKGGELFRILATMNPGGDFGKKELSPALRNRFVEVWVPAVDVASETSKDLIAKRLNIEHSWLASPIVEFAGWYNQHCHPRISVRDVVGLASFINAIAATTRYPNLRLPSSSGCLATLAHGICMTFYDGLGLGGSMKPEFATGSCEAAKKIKFDPAIFSDPIENDPVFSILFVNNNNGSTSSCENNEAESSENRDRIIQQSLPQPNLHIMLRFVFSIIANHIGTSTANAIHDIRQIILQLGDSGLAWVSSARSCGQPTRLTNALLNEDEKSVHEHLLTDDMKSRVIFGPFTFEGSPDGPAKNSAMFAFEAPASACNAARVIRALATNRPVLLEGPPGVGKTALVQALADIAGCNLIRINVSEQTDIMDLLGGDLPRGNGFAWQNGPLLDALERGCWVLLDELNLAQQAVLEGLNALLDHRRQVYIPELDKTLNCHPAFRVLAAQNPEEGGGGRKGLPKSFLNRFARIKLSRLEPSDLEVICRASVAALRTEEQKVDAQQRSIDALQEIEDIGLFTERSVGFIAAVGVVSNLMRFEGSEGWEWNLRDGLRLVDLRKALPHLPALEAANIIGRSRLRNDKDRKAFDFVTGVAFCSSVESQQLSSFCLSNFPVIGQAAFAYVRNKLNDGKLNQFKSEGVEAISASLSHDTVRITDNVVAVGAVEVHRRLPHSLSTCNVKDELFGRERSQTIHAACAAVSANWPSLIVGPSRSGKSHVIRWLATAVGVHLVEMPLTGSMDAGDVLGCFEQGDDSRFVGAVDNARKTFKAGCLAMLEGSGEELSFVETLINESSGIELEAKVVSRIKASIASLPIASKLSSSILSSWLEELDERAACVVESEKALDERRISMKNSKQHGFEWVDSALVVAIQQGHWVVLRNAHVCPPSVLDRLNSLLEPRGFLRIQESGSDRVVYPHKNFRLFITAHDRMCASVSPAFRNRSLEIFCLSHTSVAGVGVVDEEKLKVLKESQFRMQHNINSNIDIATSDVDGNKNNNTTEDHLQIVESGVMPCTTAAASLGAVLLSCSTIIKDHHAAGLLASQLLLEMQSDNDEEDIEMTCEEETKLDDLLENNGMLVAAIQRSETLKANIGCVMDSIKSMGSFFVSLGDLRTSNSAEVERLSLDFLSLPVLLNALTLISTSALAVYDEAATIAAKTFWLLNLFTSSFKPGSPAGLLTAFSPPSFASLSRVGSSASALCMLHVKAKSQNIDDNMEDDVHIDTKDIIEILSEAFLLTLSANSNGSAARDATWNVIITSAVSMASRFHTPFLEALLATTSSLCVSQSFPSSAAESSLHKDQLLLRTMLASPSVKCPVVYSRTLLAASLHFLLHVSTAPSDVSRRLASLRTTLSSSASPVALCVSSILFSPPIIARVSSLLSLALEASRGVLGSSSLVDDQPIRRLLAMRHVNPSLKTEVESVIACVSLLVSFLDPCVLVTFALTDKAETKAVGARTANTLFGNSGACTVLVAGVAFEDGVMSTAALPEQSMAAFGPRGLVHALDAIFEVLSSVVDSTLIRKTHNVKNNDLSEMIGVLTCDVLPMVVSCMRAYAFADGMRNTAEAKSSLAQIAHDLHGLSRSLTVLGTQFNNSSACMSVLTSLSSSCCRLTTSMPVTDRDIFEEEKSEQELKKAGLFLTEPHKNRKVLAAEETLLSSSVTAMDWWSVSELLALVRSLNDRVESDALLLSTCKKVIALVKDSLLNAIANNKKAATLLKNQQGEDEVIEEEEEDIHTNVKLNFAPKAHQETNIDPDTIERRKLLVEGAKETPVILIQIASTFKFAYSQSALVSFAARVAIEAACLPLESRSQRLSVQSITQWLDVVAALFKNDKRPPSSLLNAAAHLQRARWILEANDDGSMDKQLLNECLMGAAAAFVSGSQLLAHEEQDSQDQYMSSESWKTNKNSNKLEKRELFVEYDPKTIPTLKMLTSTSFVKRIRSLRGNNNTLSSSVANESSSCIDPHILDGSVVRSALAVRATSEALKQPNRSFLEGENALREFAYLYCLSEGSTAPTFDVDGQGKTIIRMDNDIATDRQLLASIIGWLLPKVLSSVLNVAIVDENISSVVSKLCFSLAASTQKQDDNLAKLSLNLFSPLLSTCNPIVQLLVILLIQSSTLVPLSSRPFTPKALALLRSHLWVTTALLMLSTSITQSIAKLRRELNIRASKLSHEAQLAADSLFLESSILGESVSDGRSSDASILISPLVMVATERLEKIKKALNSVEGDLVLRAPETLDALSCVSCGDEEAVLVADLNKTIQKVRLLSNNSTPLSCLEGFDSIATSLADQLQSFGSSTAELSRIAKTLPLFALFLEHDRKSFESSIECVNSYIFKASASDAKKDIDSCACANLSAVSCAFANRLSSNIRPEFADLTSPIILSAVSLAHGLAKTSEAANLSSHAEPVCFPVIYSTPENELTEKNLVPQLEEALTTLRWAAGESLCGSRPTDDGEETLRRLMRGLSVRLERALKRKMESEQRKVAEYLIDFDDEVDEDKDGKQKDKDDSGAEDDFDPNSGGAKRKTGGSKKPVNPKILADIQSLFPSLPTLDVKRRRNHHDEDNSGFNASQANAENEEEGFYGDDGEFKPVFKSTNPDKQQRLLEEELDRQQAKEDARIDEAVEEICELLETSVNAIAHSSTRSETDSIDHARSVLRRAMVSTLECELSAAVSSVSAVSLRSLDIRVEPLAWAALQLAESEASSRGLAHQQAALSALQGELMLDADSGVVKMKAPERSSKTVDEEALDENPLEIGETRAALTEEERYEREQKRAIKQAEEEIDETEARRLLAVERARKVKFASLLKRQIRGQRILNSKAATSFYQASNPSLSIGAWPAVEAVLNRARLLLEEYPEHAQLEYIAEVCMKFGLLPATEQSPAQLVANLEVILDRAVLWEINAAKHVSLRDQLELIKQNIVALRARQLQEWKLLRDFRERFFARKAQSWLGHLILLVAHTAPDKQKSVEEQEDEDEMTYDELKEKENKENSVLYSHMTADDRRKLSNALLSFIRSGSIGEYHARLQLLNTIGFLFLNSPRKRESDAARIFLSVSEFAGVWEAAVAFALGTARSALTKEVTGLSKLARWDMSQFDSLKATVHRSHTQLRNAIRRFDAFLSETADTHIANQLGEIPSLRLPNPNLLHAQLLAKQQSGVSSGRKSKKTRIISIGAADGWSANSTLSPLVTTFKNEIVNRSLSAFLAECLNNDSTVHLPLHLIESAGLPNLPIVRLVTQLQSVAVSHAMQRIRGVSTSPPATQALWLASDIDEALAEVPKMEVNGKLRLVRNFMQELNDQGLRPLPWAASLHLMADTTEAIYRAGSAIDAHIVLKDNANTSVILNDYFTSAFELVKSGDDAFLPLLHMALKLTTMQPHADLYAEHQKMIGHVAKCLDASITQRSAIMQSGSHVSSLSIGAMTILSEGSVQIPASMILIVKQVLHEMREAVNHALALLPDELTSNKSTSKAPTFSSNAIGNLKSNKAVVENVRIKLDSIKNLLNSSVSFIHNSPEQFLATLNSTLFSRSHLNTNGDDGLIRVREKSFIQKIFSLAKTLNELTNQLHKTVDQNSAINPLPSAVVFSLTTTLPARVNDACFMLEKYINSKSPEIRSITEVTEYEALLMKQSMLLIQLIVKSKSSPLFTTNLVSKSTEDIQIETTDESNENFDDDIFDLGDSSTTISSILDLLASMSTTLSNTAAAIPSRSSRMSPAWPFVEIALHTAGVVLISQASLFNGVASLSLKISKVVALLCERGLCKPSDRQQQATTRGEDEWNEGTGLGEGQGENDITDQIEDEQQFDGLRGEKEEPPRSKEDNKKEEDEKDNAMEVEEMDFDAPLENEKQQGKQNEDDKKEEEEEKEDHDKHEGDVDLDDGGELDDKLWNPDDDDKKKDEQEKDNKNDKKKDDIHASGGIDAEEQDELQAKEDDGDDGNEDNKNDKKDNDKKDNKKKNDKQSKKEENADNNENDEGDDDDNEDDVGMDNNNPNSNNNGEEEENEDGDEEDPRDNLGEEGTRHDIDLPEDKSKNKEGNDEDENGEGDDEDIDMDGLNDNQLDDRQEDDDLQGDENETNNIPEDDKFGDVNNPPDAMSDNQGDDVGEHDKVDIEDALPEDDKNNQNEDTDMNGDSEEQNNEEDKEDENNQDVNNENFDKNENDPREQENPQEEGDAKGKGTDAADDDELEDEPKKNDEVSAPLENTRDETIQAVNKGQANTKLNETDADENKKSTEQTADNMESGSGAVDQSQQNGKTEQASSFDSSQKNRPVPNDNQKRQVPNPLTSSEADVERWLDRVQLEDDETADKEETSGEKANTNKDQNKPLPTNAHAQQGNEGDQLALAEASAANEEDLDAKEKHRDDADEELVNDGNENNKEEDTEETENTEENNVTKKNKNSNEISKSDDKNDVDLTENYQPPKKDDDNQFDSDFDGNSDDEYENKVAAMYEGKELDFNLPSDNNQNMDEENEEDNDYLLDDDQFDEEALIKAAARWSISESTSAAAAAALAESLRLILEPSKRGRLQGDFRTGKRISMRKVVAFIASNFRRDKIWLRRTRPSKREYQVLLAIDNSKSMKEHGCTRMALDALATITQAFDKLEIGRVGVAAFGGDKPKLLTPLTEGTATARTAQQVQHLTFDEMGKDSHNLALPDLMRLALETFAAESHSLSSSVVSQLLLVVSDGRFNKNRVREWVLRSSTRGVIPVMIIIDSTGVASKASDQQQNDVSQSTSIKKKQSIFDAKASIIDSNGKFVGLESYMQDYPFPYYAVVQDPDSLPQVVSETLRQWISVVGSTK